MGKFRRSFCYACFTLGFLLLGHAMYSSWEYASLIMPYTDTVSVRTDTTSSGTGNFIWRTLTMILRLSSDTVGSARDESLIVNSLSAHGLPLDVIYEALTSLVLIITGVLMYARPLRPVHWADWAHDIEMLRGRAQRSPSNEAVIRASSDPLITAGDAILGLQFRPSFIDVRAMRNDYAVWFSKNKTSVQKLAS